MNATEIRKARRNDRLAVGFVAVVTVALLALIYGTVYPWVPGPRPTTVGRLTAVELAGAPASEELILIDARPAAEYRAGHLPGAISVDFEALRDPMMELLYTPRELAEYFAGLGITPDRPVVVYADQIKDAAYIGWVLHIMGHRNVRLLDGGIEAWKAAVDEPLETGNGTPRAPADPSAWPLAEADEWTIDDLYVDTVSLYMTALNDPEYALVDSRPFGERFSVIARQLENPKHSEYHLPWTDLVTEDGRAFKGKMALHQYTHQLPGKRPLVVYGNDPREAAVVWWALYEQGYTRTILFDDTYEFWEINFPTRRLDATLTTAPTPRIGGGCG